MEIVKHTSIDCEAPTAKTFEFKTTITKKHQKGKKKSWKKKQKKGWEGKRSVKEKRSKQKDKKQKKR
jgi:hypothetical protein